MELWLAIKLILGNKKKAIFPLLAVISGIAALVITLSISLGGKIIINKNLSSIGENRIIIGGDVLSKRDMAMVENYPFVQYAMFPKARVKQDNMVYIAYSKKALKTLGLQNLKDNEVIISQNTFQELFNIYKYDSMIISFDDDENPDDYVSGLINKLKENKGGYSNLKLLETPEVYKKIIKIKQMINRTLGIIAFVSLALGSFGILNLIGNNIKGRSGHIGILRAMGMKMNSIIKVFILEAIVISLVGSCIGIILGILGGIIIGNLINIYPVFNIFQIFLSLILSLGIGIIMGVYPTRRINRESIINILKGE